MDAAEKQALHNLRDDLQNHLVISEHVLRNLQLRNKITPTEKHVLSIHGASSTKVRKLIQIIQNREEPLQTLTKALLSESRNSFIVKKLHKKIRYYRQRSERSKDTASNYGQLTQIAEILYDRGYPKLYGTQKKFPPCKSHVKLVEGLNNFMKTLEDCRDGFNGCETRPFKDILNDYRNHKQQEINDAKQLCAKLVKSKNCELDIKSKEAESLFEQVKKYREENTKMRMNMDMEIREKVREGVKQQLLSMPMLSSSLGIFSLEQTRENTAVSHCNSEEETVCNTSYDENEEESDEHDESDDHSEESYEDKEITPSSTSALHSKSGKQMKIIHNYNIYNNHLYGDSKIFQNG